MHLSFVFFICSVCFVGALEEGEPCTLLSTGQRGICQTILSCPAAQEDIKHQKFPQPCGSVGSVPRVCCVDKDAPIPTVSTTTQTTTTIKTTPRTFTTTEVPFHLRYINPYKENEAGHKSFQKCLEYSKLVFTYEKPPILLIDKEGIRENTCGFRIIPLIIGGKPAGRREFPHMALIGYDSPDGVQWLCGGTLISENFILTASHCLISTEFGNATDVRLGVTEKHNPAKRQDRKVVQLIKHPDYLPPPLYNDIGLLKLDKKVEFNTFVRPACLHNFKNPLGEKAIATGWGNTEDMVPSDKMMKVTLDLSDPVQCFNSFSRISQEKLERGIDEKTMFCAGSHGMDTCLGDSGGPIQIYSPIDCMYEIVGVTSFGKYCGVGRSPGVYTRVAPFTEWLEKIIFE